MIINKINKNKEQKESICSYYFIFLLFRQQSSNLQTTTFYKFIMLLHIAQNKNKNNNNNKREISKSSNKTHDTQIYPTNIYTNTSKYTKKSTDLPDILDVNCWDYMNERGVKDEMFTER